MSRKGVHFEIFPRDGCVTSWLVKEGEKVTKHDNLCSFKYPLTEEELRSREAVRREYLKSRKELKEEQTLALGYSDDDDGSSEEEEEMGNEGEIKLTASMTGKISQLMIVLNQNYKKGEKLMEIETGCLHPETVQNLCTSCGINVSLLTVTADDEEEEEEDQMVSVLSSSSSVAIKRRLSDVVAKGKKDMQMLTKSRKLALIVDLDQTLIHSTNSALAPYVSHWLRDPDFVFKDIQTFALPGSPMQYYVKVRSHCQEFLEELNKTYEMTVYTMGLRPYALKIAAILDPDHKFFGDRILSREDGFDQNFKLPTLQALFPYKTNQLVIIDDREDVWKNIPNLVHVHRYVFYEGVADLNATPRDIELQDQEDDEMEVDKTKAEDALENGDQKIEIEVKEEDLQDPVFDENTRNAYAMIPQLRTADTDSKILLARLKLAISKCGQTEKDIKAGDKKAWVALGHHRALRKISELLYIQEYDGAVKRLRACRVSFGEKKHGIFGKNEKYDFPVLKNLLLPAPPTADPDDVLKSIGNVLDSVHHLYYTSNDDEEADCAEAIQEFKSSILEGLVFVFTGVFPQVQNDPEKKRLLKKAAEFGAQVVNTVDSQVTHVIGLRNKTSKIHDAQELQKEGHSVCIVDLKWLKDCIAHFDRKDENDYQLLDVPVRGTESFSFNPIFDDDDDEDDDEEDDDDAMDEDDKMDASADTHDDDTGIRQIKRNMSDRSVGSEDGILKTNKVESSDDDDDDDSSEADDSWLLN